MTLVHYLDSKVVWPHQTGRPVVILPFYGEFGHFINSFIRQVEYIRAPEKVVCCCPGDEIYFPSADKFYYEWTQQFSANEKVGYRNCWPPTPTYSPSADEDALVERLARLFPGHQILFLAEPLADSEVLEMPIRLNDATVLVPPLDVVVCCRRREWDEYRNFSQWESVLRPLAAAGMVIGIVGEKETSYDLDFVQFRSWAHSSKSLAVVGAISRARLYIGTDTGPTHLAAIVSPALLVFRNENCPNKNYLREVVALVAKARRIPFTYLEDGWEHSQRITETALQLLLETSR